MRTLGIWIFVSFVCKPSLGCSGRFLNLAIQTTKDVIGEFEDGMSHKKLLRHDDEADRIKQLIEAKIIPLDQIYQPHPSLGNYLVDIYTDITGCYETGHSRDYNGRMSVTMTLRRCAPWVNLTWNLQETIHSLSKRLADSVPLTALDRRLRRKIRRRVQRLNDTMQMLFNEGYILHNYCRDPENIGRPWCVVNTIDGLEWERCPVPLCTPCWRVRQNAVHGILSGHGMQNWTHIWLPNCTLKGKFNHTQFWENYCWCSTAQGRILNGTMVRKDSNGCSHCEELINSTAK